MVHRYKMGIVKLKGLQTVRTNDTTLSKQNETETRRLLT